MSVEPSPCFMARVVAPLPPTPSRRPTARPGAIPAEHTRWAVDHWSNIVTTRAQATGGAGREFLRLRVELTGTPAE